MILKRLLIAGILVAGAVLIFIGVFNLIGSGNQDVANTEATAPPQAAAGGEVGLGETASFSDRTITLNDLQPGFTFPSNIPHAQRGYEFVLANITIENTTNQPIQVSPLSFQSEDANGVRLNPMPLDKQPDPITVDTTIGPNEELTGNLVVETVQDAQDVKLVYRPLA